MPPDVVRDVLLVIVFGGLSLLLAIASVRRVSANEWLVRFRRGVLEPRATRGPARVLLAPLFDRGVHVPVGRQDFALDAVPIGEAAGAGLLVDVNIGFRVVDPIAYVTNLIPPPAGLRALVRGAAHKSLQDDPGIAMAFPGDLERAIAPLVEARLASAGARDVVVSVLRARSGAVDDADEAEFQVLLRQEHLTKDVDPVDARDLGGDVRWAIKKVGRMARWEPITIAAVAIGTQFLHLVGETPWSSSSLLLGICFGILLAPIAEIRDQIGTRHPRRGFRRTVFWIIGLVVWTAVLLGLALLIAAASGVLRLASPVG